LWLLLLPFAPAAARPSNALVFAPLLPPDAAAAAAAAWFMSW
jgi:hypothetical protein